uniref:Cholinephosphotransferase 1 n=1 Tax=Monodelphis domestica TaxID=13616 RepID=A0A5F8GLM0_MONDO
MAACGSGCCGGSCCAGGQITGSAGRGSFWKATASPLSLVQLRRLEEHRYSSEGSSLFEPVLQPFWSWLVELVPLWLAPNAITLLGLLLNLLSSLLLVFYCPTVLEEAPSWVFLICGLGLFSYQSLDAIDGKHARRTNTSSPLGELFDHGCDCISTVFVSLGASIATRLGTDPEWLFFCCFVGMFMFYCAHWQTYVSGVLRFGRVDVTEVQIAITIVFFITAIGGTMMWDYTIPVIQLKLKMLPLIGILTGAFISCFNYFQVILGGGVGKNGSTTAVAHMTKSKLKLQDSAFIGPALLFFDQYFNHVIDEYIVLWVAMIISLFTLLKYFITVVVQIADHLNLQVFRIPPPPAPVQVQNHD